MTEHSNTPKQAGSRRAPCKRGEYTVISLDGPAPTNTIIMQDATSAQDALRGRLALGSGNPRAGLGRWVVTTGRLSFIYEVHRTGRITQVAGLSPAQEAELYDD